MNRHSRKMSIILSLIRSLFRAAFFVLAWSRLFSQDVALPPKCKPEMAFTEAINHRMSVRAFQRNPVSMEKLSWILWAADRVRIDGKMEGKIVVAMNDSSFVYNPDEHVLHPASDSIPGLRMAEAPVHLYLLPMSSELEEQDNSLWIWRGMAGQAIYLGAPALGLGTVTVRGIGFPLGHPGTETVWMDRSLPPEAAYPDLTSLETFALDTLLEQLSRIPEETDMVSEEAVSRLLWSAYGFSFLQEQGGRIHRSVPSARGKYPMTIYPVSSKGLFRYVPETNTLETLLSSDIRMSMSEAVRIEWIREASQLFLLMWDEEKLASKNSAFYEAGAMLFNVRLMSRAMGHPVVWSSIELDSLGLSVPDYRFPESQKILMIIGIKSRRQPSENRQTLRDGTYQGEIQEWPEMKVEVAVENGRIQKITILDDRGTPAFTERMRAVLPQRMIDANTAEVDGISGATLSSNHLKKAMKDALQKAR
jgi:uncharacterized protein with FMN-binding domain